MPYLPSVNTYLHQSSLLIQAYPTTTRITTKYSLPRKTKTKSKSKGTTQPSDSEAASEKPVRERLPPSATLILKTFEADSGICLKYKTDKSAEVGRLMTGLGRLAAGEVIEMPTAVSTALVEDKMDVDDVAGTGSGVASPKVEDTKVPVQAQGGGAGAGKGKKKKGKK